MVSEFLQLVMVLPIHSEIITARASCLTAAMIRAIILDCVCPRHTITH